MSNIKADKFTWKSGESGGVTGSSVNGDQVVFGVAKSWGYYSVSVNTPTVSTSLNISSMTYNGAGDWTITFASALSSSQYAPSGWARVSGNGGVFTGVNDTTFTSSTFRFGTTNSAGTFSNPLYGSFVIHSKNS